MRTTAPIAGCRGRVEATDQRFADKDTPLKPTPAAPFRIGMMLESIDRSDGMEFNFNANLDITLDLPNIEERLRLFITSDDLDEAPDTARDEGRLRAGLRYQIFRHLDFDLGIRVDVPPVAFASLKWTHEYELGKWDFYPLAKMFVETKESFGYALGTTFDRWSGRHLWRSSTYAKWRHDRNQTEWSQSLVYARAHELIVPDRYGSYPRANDIGRGWGVRVLASGEDTNVVSVLRSRYVLLAPGCQWLAVLVCRATGALGQTVATGTPTPASAWDSMPCSGISLDRRGDWCKLLPQSFTKGAFTWARGWTKRRK